MSNANKTLDQSKENDKNSDKGSSCCACSCSKDQIAAFLRHLAAFFDKK